MATVVVTVKERIATIPSGVSLVCNNPSDVIQFNFDSEWNSVTLKTARFTWQRSYVDVPFAGNNWSCAVYRALSDFIQFFSLSSAFRTSPVQYSTRLDSIPKEV